MSRWRAASIHFLISLAVFGLLLAVILLVWYPGILFSVDGGWTGLRIVIGVDLVLGPLLTFVVFKAGKPGLKFDLSCIAIVQIACMSAGMWVVYTERPIALVLTFDTIYSLAAQDFIAQGRDPNIINAFEGGSPKLLYVELPEDEVAAGLAFMRSQMIGEPLYVQTDKLRLLPSTAEGLAAVFRRSEAVKREIPDGLIEQSGDACLYSKFVSTVTSGYVCFDTEARALQRFYDDELAGNEN